MSLRDVVVNNGRATARRSATGFYLSADSHLNRGDRRIGGRAAGPLRPHRRSRGRTRLRIPAAAAPGTYRLLACADYLRRIRERNERDNCAVATARITVEGPLPNPNPQPNPDPMPAPIPVTLSTPADGSSTNAQDAPFAGTAGTGALVTVSVTDARGDVASVQTLPAGDGSWATTVAGLNEGSYSATASQTDAFGRTHTTVAHQFRVDRTAPAPALTAPPDATKDTTPTVAGTRGTDSGDSRTVTLRLYSGATATGPAILTESAASDSSAWSVDLENDLGLGTYTARAEQSDAAGNVGFSAPRVFQVNDQGPLVTLADPATGLRTNDTTPTISGDSDATASAVTVRIYRGGDVSGTVAQTLSASHGPWSVTPSPLTPGDYTVQATQSDGIGNVGTSAPHTFTVDTTAPTVTIAHPSGSTNDTTPTFDGAAGTADGDMTSITVDVYNGSATSGTAVQHLTTAAANGAWSVVPSTGFAQGSYTAVVRQSDSAGNSASDSRAFTVDTSAPVVTVTSPAASSVTSDSTPAFSGSAEAGPVTVKIYAGSTAGGTPVSTLSATGPTWSVDQPTTLSDGAYTAVAEQTDAAGNVGTSSPRTFTIDTAGPAVTLAQPADGAVTGDSTPTFSGTAEATNPVTVKIYIGSSAGGTPTRTLAATLTGSNWTATPGTALPQGTYTAQAEQSDAASNVGKSTPHSFEIDTTQPTLTLVVNASHTGVHVTADDANFDSLACTADGQPATIAPTAPSTHAAEGDVTVTGDGSHTIDCTATDRASNAKTDSKTFTLDSTPPAVGLSSPAAGATIDDPTPTFSGSAGTASGDAATVTLKVWSGTATIGAPAATLSAAVAGSTWTTTATTPLAEGTYTARAEQADSASNTGTSPAHTFTIGPATMLAAGDIGGCETGNEAAGTAAILRAHPQGIVQTLGDNVYGNAQYADGTLADFQNCFGPNWGTEKARTNPAIGNHEYNDPGAAGYFDYFGAVAGNRSEGWYSYDLGAWHIVVLNSNCSQVGGCFAGSDQEQWLRADLQAHPARCTAAVWHHARFTSDAFTGQATNTGPLWTALDEARADLVLNGHSHEYERFAPKSPTGAVPANGDGIIEIVAGMGGESHSSFASTPQSGSQVRDNTHFGVLELTLHQTSFAWDFLPVGGGAPLDSGTATCRS